VADPMSNTSSFYVIAPIDGIHLDFDYRMYSAELYGCSPDYKPNPKACPEFRQPYELFGRIPFQGYGKLVPTLISDASTISVLPDMPDRRMNEYTCIGFEIDLDRSAVEQSGGKNDSEALFKQIVEKGETFLDPLRLCIFKPGKNESAGRFGSVGNGIQCFWIGENERDIRFYARKSLRYTLTQQPIDILGNEFGPIYADITFRGLCFAVFENPLDRSAFQERILRAVKSFRQSRDISSPEARFRQLAAIAEDLAKFKDDDRVFGQELRTRITKISSHGWLIYQNYNDAVIGRRLIGRNSELLQIRYQEIGWDDEDTARKTIKDLWDNVRNPFSHSLETFETLERDADQDIANAERVVVTMINGWYTANEIQELMDKPLSKILMDEE
jgi:hypothetical protein